MIRSDRGAGVLTLIKLLIVQFNGQCFIFNVGMRGIRERSYFGTCPKAVIKCAQNADNILSLLFVVAVCTLYNTIKDYLKHFRKKRADKVTGHFRLAPRISPPVQEPLSRQ